MPQMAQTSQTPMGEQPQEAENSTKNAPERAMKEEPQKDEGKELEGLKTEFQKMLEPLQKSIDEIKASIKPEETQIADLRKQLEEALTEDEKGED